MASNRKDIPQPTGSVDPRNRKIIYKPNNSSFIGPPKPPGYVRPSKSNDSKPQPTGAVTPINKSTNKSKNKATNKPTNKSKNKAVQNNKDYGAPEPMGTVDPRNRAYTPKTLNPSNHSNPELGIL